MFPVYFVCFACNVFYHLACGYVSTLSDSHSLLPLSFLHLHRAQKEAALAQRAKDKAKKTKGGFFGFGGSKAPTKEEEEVDAEQDHDDKEEVMGCVE